MNLPESFKYSLGSLDFPRGILVFLPGSLFFLGSTEQYKAMKIGITFFGSKLDLLCISKVLPIFCVFSKIRLKRKTPGDTWCTRRVPGVGGSRAGALGELPGGALGARPRGTRGGLGGIRGKSPSRGTRGQVSRSEASRAIITRWARDTCPREPLPGDLPR